MFIEFFLPLLFHAKRDGRTDEKQFSASQFDFASSLNEMSHMPYQLINFLGSRLARGNVGESFCRRHGGDEKGALKSVTERVV
jgi:hypothetical protein